MKKIFLVFMIILPIFSWYFVMSEGRNNDQLYYAYLENAQKCLDKKIYVDAVDYYKKAIDIYPDIIGNKLKLASIYKEFKMDSSYESYCKSLSVEIPDSMEPIILLGDYYTEIGKPEKAISLYKSNIHNFPDSIIIQEKLDELKSSFKIDYSTYEYVSSFQNGYSIFRRKNSYGIMDDRGNVIIGASYDDAGVFDLNNKLSLAPVSEDNKYFYVDKNSNTRLVSDKKYDYLGSFAKNGLAVYMIDGKYGYIDRDFNESDKLYDFATSYYNYNVAAVMDNNQWYLIDSNFNRLSDESYEEIKYDDLLCSVHAGIIIVKKNGKYMLIDIEGKRICEPIYDNIDFFISANEPAACKVEDKWGFINNSGELVIEPCYEQALSFSCGFAPIKINEYWGYIDLNKRLVIEPQFLQAKSFNKAGVAPVLKSSWHLIKLDYYGGEN